MFFGQLRVIHLSGIHNHKYVIQIKSAQIIVYYSMTFYIPETDQTTFFIQLIFNEKPEKAATKKAGIVTNQIGVWKTPLVMQWNVYRTLIAH